MNRFGNDLRAMEPHAFLYAYMFKLTRSFEASRVLHTRAPNDLIEREMIALRANLRALGAWCVQAEGPTASLAPYKVTGARSNPVDFHGSFDVSIHQQECIVFREISYL